MKYYYFFLMLLFFASCNRPKELNPVLAELKEQSSAAPDSARLALENLYPGKQFDKYNRACYFLLLTGARHDNGESLLDSDTLINVMLKSFSKKYSPDLLAQAFLWKGRVWNELGKPEEAVGAYNQGIDILDNHNTSYPETLSKLYDDLGYTHFDQGLYEDALEIFRKEYALDKSIDDYRGLAFSLRNIGSVYSLLGLRKDGENYRDSALYYYEQALQYALQSSDSISLPDYIYNDISLHYSETEEYEKAFKEIKKIRSLSENIKLNKASLFIHFNQLDSASFLLDSTISSTNVAVVAASNLNYSLIEQKKGNYEAALEYYTKFKDASDSLYKQRKANELKAIDHLYNIDKEKAKIKNKYTFWISAVVTFVIFLLAAIWGRLNYVSKKRKLAEAKRERELLYKEKEISELKDEMTGLEEEISRLKTINTDNKEIKEKEAEKDFIELTIEYKRFKEKPIYGILMQMKLNIVDKLSASQLEELKNAIDFSFSEYILQLKEKYPSIKEDVVMIFCLKKLKFTYSLIGRIFNLTDSAIRKKVTRLEQKEAAKR